jgi:Flp pilus assembly protein TadG
MSKFQATSPLKSKIAGVFKRFLHDSAGNLTVMSGFMAIPIFLAAGAAIDIARVTREQAAFYNSVDAAALAVASDDRSAMGTLSGTALENRRKELEDYAKKFIAADYKDASGGASVITANLTITGQEVKIAATIDFPTTIMAITGIKKMTLKTESTIKKAARPVELVMVMDTTGSMGSGGKMTGAKAAARALLDTVYDGSLATKSRSEYVRVALVPFAGAVRLDQAGSDFNMNWIDTTGINPISTLNFSSVTAPSTWNNFTAWAAMKKDSTTQLAWDGCVEARKRGNPAIDGDLNVNDVTPVSTNGNTLFPAYFVPDAPSNNYTGTDRYGNNYTRSDDTSRYGNDYIQGYSTTDAGSECKGLTNAQCFATDDAGLLLRQENYNKYAGVQITPSNGPSSNCATSKVVPMTYDRQSIDDGITAMSAKGPTLIAEGLAWGLRAISPTEPFTQVEGSGSIPGSTIAAYDSPRWRKIMILMTDGDNDLGAGDYDLNTTTYSAYGRGSETLADNRFGTTDASEIMTNLDTSMLDACTRIKSAGIEIYVTSFGSGVSTITRNRLKACATNEDHYQHSATPTDLVSFFDHIGETINKQIYVAK